jgi:hypothetical protein
VTGPESLPVLNPTYESAAHKNLFFIGSLMHSLDYRQSAGCSVRGFRHLIAFFYQIHYAKAFSTHSFAEPGGAKKALQHILERMNTSAALFHMHGQLADIFYYDSARKSIEYMESVSPWLLHQNQFPVSSSTYVCVLTLEYGKKPADRLSKLGRKLSRIGSENRATRLHPVVRIYKDVSQSGKQLLEEIHLDENLYADFTDKEVYTNRLVRILRMILH